MKRSTLCLAATASLLVIAASAPDTALAWRQSKTCHTFEDKMSGAPSLIPLCQGEQRPYFMSWPGQQVDYLVHQEGAPSIDGAEPIGPDLLGAIVAGVEEWNTPGCSEFALSYQGLTPTPGHLVDEDGNPDRQNVIAFIDDASWPATTSAVAITTSTVPVGSGRMIDADVELNERYFDFSIALRPPLDRHDVANVVAHEAGHMAALDESDHPEATMYYQASLGEVIKRDLSSDDVAGLCAIYPLGTKPPADQEEGCCTTAPRPRPGQALPSLLALCGLIALGRRRRRQSCL